MADTSVSSFLAKYSDGFAHANKYLVRFNLPSGIAQSGTWMNMESGAGQISRIQRQLNYYNTIDVACHSLVMPGRTLMVADHKQIGGPFRVPYSQTYDPVIFSFYANRNLDVRHYFEVWQTAVINVIDNSMNFYDEYVSDVYIAQLDRKGNKTYNVTLRDAYPLTIGDVNYSYASSHQLQDITVTLSYRLWLSGQDTTHNIESRDM